MAKQKNQMHWRMQLHPTEPKLASFYASQSLSAGFIGLDFSRDVGDLFKTTKDELPLQQRDYWAFAHTMKKGDLVLIICHHFPFALVRVASDYNYIRNREPEIGVWFRHFRRVDGVRYYSDLRTNAKSWEQLKMTDTISPLYDAESASYRLIASWI
jgi:hypothetical protein